MGVCLSLFDVASDLGRSVSPSSCACARLCSVRVRVRVRVRAYGQRPQYSVVSYVASDSIGTAAAIASLIGLNMSLQVAAPAYPAMCLYRYGRTHADASLYLAVCTYTGIFTDNRAHLPQIFVVVFRTKQLGLAVALPEVYPCTRAFVSARACACGGSRACLRLGRAARGAVNAAAALGTFGLFVCLCICLLFS